MRFLVTHVLEPGFTKDKAIEIAKLTQTDPDVKGYRSFLSPTAGKGICIFDAPDKDRLVKWLDEHKLAYETIWPVELESDRGEFIDLPVVATVDVPT